jgi:hypothetical protein
VQHHQHPPCNTPPPSPPLSGIAQRQEDTLTLRQLEDLSKFSSWLHSEGARTLQKPQTPRSLKDQQRAAPDSAEAALDHQQGGNRNESSPQWHHAHLQQEIDADMASLSLWGSTGWDGQDASSKMRANGGLPGVVENKSDVMKVPQREHVFFDGGEEPARDFDWVGGVNASENSAPDEADDTGERLHETPAYRDDIEPELEPKYARMLAVDPQLRSVVSTIDRPFADEGQCPPAEAELYQNTELEAWPIHLTLVAAVKDLLTGKQLEPEEKVATAIQLAPAWALPEVAGHPALGKWMVVPTMQNLHAVTFTPNDSKELVGDVKLMGSFCYSNEYRERKHDWKQPSSRRNSWPLVVDRKLAEELYK